MSRQTYAPPVGDGVLLARLGYVHRRVGKGGQIGSTTCGQRFDLHRAATVNDVQALVHKLPLCPRCYLDNFHKHGGGHR